MKALLQVALVIIAMCFASDSVSSAVPKAWSPPDVDITGRLYDPNLDSRIRFGEAGLIDSSNRLFGWYEQGASMFLEVVQELGSSATVFQVENLFRQTATVELAAVYAIDVNRFVRREDDTLAFAWFGRVSRGGTTIVCGGVLITSEIRAVEKVSVLITFTDESDGLELVGFIEELGLPVGPRRAECAYDAQGVLDLQGLLITSRACYETRFDNLAGIELLCGATGLAACWAGGPFNPICLAAMTCLAVAAANAMIFYRNFRTEYYRTADCVCLQSLARQGGLPPPANCPPFSCPPFAINPSFK